MAQHLQSSQTAGQWLLKIQAARHATHGLNTETRALLSIKGIHGELWIQLSSRISWRNSGVAGIELRGEDSLRYLCAGPQ